MDVSTGKGGCSGQSSSVPASHVHVAAVVNSALCSEAAAATSAMHLQLHQVCKHGQDDVHSCTADWQMLRVFGMHGASGCEQDWANALLKNNPTQLCQLRSQSKTYGMTAQAKGPVAAGHTLHPVAPAVSEGPKHSTWHDNTSQRPVAEGHTLNSAAPGAPAHQPGLLGAHLLLRVDM